jgi:hypothetical protein
MSDTRQLAYQIILGHAVDFANSDDRKPWYLGGDTFKEPHSYEHLELWYDSTLVEGAIAEARDRQREVRTSEEIFELLTEIVRDAVIRSINDIPECAEAFAAIIVDNARSGTSLEGWF